MRMFCRHIQVGKVNPFLGRLRLLFMVSVIQLKGSELDEFIKSIGISSRSYFVVVVGGRSKDLSRPRRG